MTSRQNLLLSAAILILFGMMSLIIYGDKGMADLKLLRQGRDELRQTNADLVQENLMLYRSIERLKKDPVFIENVARHELGVIKKNEIIFKTEEKEAGSHLPER